MCINPSSSIFIFFFYSLPSPLDEHYYRYLMQVSGKFLQSVLHRNRSQDNQPMGGVLASPFSNANVTQTMDERTSNSTLLQKFLQEKKYKIL